MVANPPTQDQPLLEVEGLSKRFGDAVALANVSFSIREKEIVGVIAPNDAGKTILLECIAGLRSSDAGTVAWQKRALRRSHGKTACFIYPMGSCLSARIDQAAGIILNVNPNGDCLILHRNCLENNHQRSSDLSATPP